MACGAEDLPARSTLHDYLGLWRWNGTLDRMHHTLHVACREQAGREASPTAAIIDNFQRLSIAFGNRTFASSARASRAQKKGASIDPHGYDAGKKIKGGAAEGSACAAGGMAAEVRNAMCWSTPRV